MTEKQPAAIAGGVLRRERRRVRLLAAATITLWALAALTVPALFFPLRAQVLWQADALEQSAVNREFRVDAYSVALDVVSMVRGAIFASSWLLTILTATSLLAAVCTIALVLTVRRITLRQLGEGLAEISEQLRLLRGSAP
jgi:hypothetical protein